MWVQEDVQHAVQKAAIYIYIHLYYQNKNKVEKSWKFSLKWHRLFWWNHQSTIPGRIKTHRPVLFVKPDDSWDQRHAGSAGVGGLGLGTGSPGCLEGVTSYQSLIVAMDTQVDGRPWSDGVLTFSAASVFKSIQLHLAACLMPLRPIL